MALITNRIKSCILVGLAAAGILTGCGTKVSDASPDSSPAGVEIVEASLSDGRYLDCTQNHVYLDHDVLNCDWAHPRDSHDASKEQRGPFKVFQKQLTDGRALDCIAFNAYMGNNVDDCDWTHIKRITIVTTTPTP